MEMPKRFKVDQDAAIAWAYIYMQTNALTIDDLNNYLIILKAILPENYYLFGVYDAIGFVLERYPVFKLVDNVVYLETSEQDFLRYFNTYNYSKELFKDACDILKSILEDNDKITNTDVMTLDKTI